MPSATLRKYDGSPKPARGREWDVWGLLGSRGSTELGTPGAGDRDESGPHGGNAEPRISTDWTGPRAEVTVKGV